MPGRGAVEFERAQHGRGVWHQILARCSGMEPQRVILTCLKPSPQLKLNAEQILYHPGLQLGRWGSCVKHLDVMCDRLCLEVTLIAL